MNIGREIFDLFRFDLESFPYQVEQEIKRKLGCGHYWIFLQCGDGSHHDGKREEDVPLALEFPCCCYLLSDLLLLLGIS